MATIFNSDLETETSAFTTEWDSKTEEGSNTLAISTTAAHVHGGTNGAIVTFDGTNNGCYAVKTIADNGDVYVRLYVKMAAAFEVTPNYNTVTFLELKDGTQNLASCNFYVQTESQTFRYYVTYWNGSTNTATCNVEGVPLGEWILFELHWTAGTGANGGCEVKVNGSSIGSSFAGAQSASLCDTIRVGATAIGSGIPTAGSELYFDDFASDDADWVGASEVAVDITPPVLTTSISIYDPVVTGNLMSWDMGAYIYAEAGSGVAIAPPLLQTQIQIFDPVVYAVDVPTAITPNLMTTQLTMLSPHVSVTTGQSGSKICRFLHLVMGR